MRRKRIGYGKKILGSNPKYYAFLYMVFGIFILSIFSIIAIQYRKQDAADAAKQDSNNSLNRYYCTVRQKKKMENLSVRKIPLTSTPGVERGEREY